MNPILFKYVREIRFFLFVLILLVTASGLITYSQVSSQLEQEHFQKLSVLKNALKEHLEFYFENQKTTLSKISNSRESQQAIRKFAQTFQEMPAHSFNARNYETLRLETDRYLDRVNFTVPGGKDRKTTEEYIPSSASGRLLQLHYIVQNPLIHGKKELMYRSSANFSYDHIHETHHPYFMQELRRSGFYDLFLIDEKGNIVYSVQKEFDLGTNLRSGPYSESSLSDVYRKALKKERAIVFSDFKLYKPSYNRAAAFLASTVHDPSGKRLGVIAAQLSIDAVNRMVTLRQTWESSGLEKTGEAYLVGPDGLMRSDSRFLGTGKLSLEDKLGTTVGIRNAMSASVKRSLDGATGEMMVKNYRNQWVYSSYTPVNVFGRNWAMLVEIDKKEVSSAIFHASLKILIVSALLPVIVLLFIAYIFYVRILQPSDRREKEMVKNIAETKSRLDESGLILEQYKKAVDFSSIVSKTNPAGIITYVNDAFCETSGYTREELIGRPHNIIRHPDMPGSVYEDLWHTIRNKRHWSGVIRNRKKDGSDYYVKSTIMPILSDDGKLQEYISIRSEITDLIQTEQKLLDQTTDSLTRLPNRIKLQEDLTEIDGLASLSLIRIDRLKEYREIYGKQILDELVNRIAETFSRILPENLERIYRIDDDEFAILDPDGLEMERFIRRINAVLSYFDHNVIGTENESFNVSLTAGISRGPADRIYYQSDMALHKAIDAGKARWVIQEQEDLEKGYLENIQMIKNIKESIRDNRIVLFRQEIQPVSSEAGVKKYENLVRMQVGDEILSPFYFLDLAKKARLYSTITKIVIEKAFQCFSENDYEFSINMNIEDILNDEIVGYLKRMIDYYGIGNRLVIELVESEGIENFEAVSSFIKTMKELGCKIAIDDFGTGYSNFEYLLKIDADYIKIDGSLIRNLDRDSASEVVVQLIVNFAKKMKIKTIAEFVHNEAVYKKVKSMGVDYAQGYFIEKPVPCDFS